MSNICSLFLMILLLGICSPPAVRAEERAGKPQFRPAELTSATAMVIPLTAISSGTLVFEVKVSADGAVEDVEVRRALEPFTARAVRAIREWQFRPATLAGKPVASSVTVAVTFNPRAFSYDDVPLPPLEEESKSESLPPGFQPPAVEHASFPGYPMGAVNVGMVVLEVDLNEKGEVQRTKVVRDLPPFTGKSLAVVKNWKFSPAKFNGKPVSSKIFLAFVFPAVPPPPISNDH